MRMRSAYLWIMAARARGVPDYIVNLCYRARDYPNANKSELYQLVLRAETDHTWRFWHDLFLAHRNFCIPITLGHASGIALTATVVALGAQYLQSKKPGLSFPLSALGFLVTTHCLGKAFAVGCGLMTDYWLILRAPRIGRR